MRGRLLILTVLASMRAFPGDWPRFRGPNGSGVSESTGVPVEFGRAKNVRWRVAVPPGGSSPVIAGERLFLTAYEGKRLLTLCFDVSGGKLLWRREIEAARAERRTSPNDPATPSPVTDGDSVYVLFPDFGLISYTADGKERWRVPLPPFNPPHGMATSPILAGDKVIVAADQISGSFVAAFSTSDGRLVWRKERPGLVGGYSTPIMYGPPGQSAEVLVSSPLELAAYAVETGEKVWFAERMGVMPVAVPVLGDGLVFVNSSAVPPFEDLAVTFKADKDRDGKLTPDEFPDPAFRDAVLSIDRVYGDGDGAIDAREWNGALKLMQGMNALAAIRPGPAVAQDQRESWRMTKGLPDVPSPLFYQGLLYVVKDGGILTALNTKTGEIVKQTRIQGALDKFFASPIAADGKIYLTSENGKIAVVSAGRELSLLAVNDLAEECYATPAIANSGLYVRTSVALYYFAAGRA